MTLLSALKQANILRPIDDALAQSLRRLAPDTPDEVLAAAALASLAVSHGHAGFNPASPQQLTDADLPWPDANTWLQTLATSPWVATPTTSDEEATAAPLALEHGLLYLRRYREYESHLAQQLRRIAAHPMPEADITAVANLFQTLFPKDNKNQPSFPRRRESSDVDTNTKSLDSRLRGNDEKEQLGLTFPGNLSTTPPAGEGAQSADEGEALPIDHQARAAALALRRALLLITGGPGTGKTTTIARLLVLRIAQALQAGQQPPRIALAAPTGRAAERMAESLRRAAQQMTDLGVDATPGSSPGQALLAALPTHASTLHRLLGTLPDAPRFRHHADNPLPYDIVVVDEASMVDLPLMCKLTQAVAQGAQLVLLGDPDQLPSVEAGDVLAAILAAAGPGDALSAEDAKALAPLLRSSPSLARKARRGGPGRGALALDRHPHDLDRHPRTLERHSREGGDPATLLLAEQHEKSLDSRLRGNDEQKPTAPSTQHALQGHRVHLRHGYRQDAALDLAPLAEAVRDGNAREVLSLLRGGTLSNVTFHENTDDPLQAHPDLLTHWRALATQTDPAHALRQANRLRLLTALREGPQGARGLNARIEAALSGRRLGTPPPWFPGRLLLVTENSYRHHLFNGDVGLCLPGDDGTPLVWFPGNGGGADAGDPGSSPGQAVRAFHPAALPMHESAFATTVHKAQGSEFDEVWLQLPRVDARVLSRELLYTGLSRARSVLHIAGSADVIEAALSRHASRVSGLGWRLGA